MSAQSITPARLSGLATRSGKERPPTRPELSSASYSNLRWRIQRATSSERLVEHTFTPPRWRNRKDHAFLDNVRCLVATLTSVSSTCTRVKNRNIHKTFFINGESRAEREKENVNDTGRIFGGEKK
jgi:hypothetical protein